MLYSLRETATRAKVRIDGDKFCRKTGQYNFVVNFERAGHHFRTTTCIDECVVGEGTRVRIRGLHEFKNFGTTLGLLALGPCVDE